MGSIRVCDPAVYTVVFFSGRNLLPKKPAATPAGKAASKAPKKNPAVVVKATPPKRSATRDQKEAAPSKKPKKG